MKPYSILWAGVAVDMDLRVTQIRHTDSLTNVQGGVGKEAPLETFSVPGTSYTGILRGKGQFS